VFGEDVEIFPVFKPEEEKEEGENESSSNGKKKFQKTLLLFCEVR